MVTDHEGSKIGRRDFLKKAGKVGLAFAGVAASVATGYGISEVKQKVAKAPQSEKPKAPDQEAREALIQRLMAAEAKARAETATAKVQGKERPVRTMVTKPDQIYYTREQARIIFPGLEPGSIKNGVVLANEALTDKSSQAAHSLYVFRNDTPMTIQVNTDLIPFTGTHDQFVDVQREMHDREYKFIQNKRDQLGWGSSTTLKSVDTDWPMVREYVFSSNRLSYATNQTFNVWNNPNWGKSQNK